jgi:hypothetical protein
MINDQNREWTESPKDQESQTQQDYDLVHIPSMRKTRTRPKTPLCQAQVASFEQASIFQCRHTHILQASRFTRPS